MDEDCVDLDTHRHAAPAYMHPLAVLKVPAKERVNFTTVMNNFPAASHGRPGDAMTMDNVPSWVSRDSHTAYLAIPKPSG